MHDWITKCLDTYDKHQVLTTMFPDWSVRKTATHIGRSKSQVAEDIRLACAIKQDPLIKNLNRQDAVRRITSVQHWCSSCKLPNVQHVTDKECITALAQELERYRDGYNAVRRLSREMISELEDF